MFTIHLTNLQFKAYHGLYPQEKILGNKFIVNLHVHYKAINSIITIADTINYEKLFALVQQQMNIATPLLETVAQNIAKEILKSFSEALEVDICIAKKNAPIQCLIGNVAVQYCKKR